MSFKENSKIYYGLDIGTDSVGWSTTNEKYELLRYKNNLMWGVSLFEAASLAEERRGHRTQRRRYDRRQQRVALLGELFAKEILKTDPDFFLRLKESSLYVLKGQKTISDAKVCEYEQHKSDLKALKYIVRKYLDRAQYDEIFRTAGEKPNYVSYSYNVTDVKLKQLPSNFKKKNSEEFCKYIKSKLEKIKPESDDEAVYNELIEKCNSKTLCPKQVTDENRVIPYQLYYHELSMILDKASAYLDFLNKTEDGISVKQKILTLMKFRIPYFVGPLVKRNETDNVWIVRKAEGRIYPWNFENMVDFDKSEDGFIRRMTCKCTYLAGEDVLQRRLQKMSSQDLLNVSLLKQDSQQRLLQRCLKKCSPTVRLFM